MITAEQCGSTSAWRTQRVTVTSGGAEITVEAHVLDVDEDFYDQPARLAFQARLRPEQAFPGVEALVAQIRQDMERGRAALGAAGIPDAI